MSNHYGTASVLLVIAMLAPGCGSTAPALPDVHPLPSGTPGAPVLRLQGAVQGSAYQPLSEVTIEVLTGPSTGLTALTDASGAFSLAGTFDRTESLRASKDGYTTAIQPYGAHIAFVLRSLAPAVDIRGEYTLTITADPACTTLPDAVRMRSYTALIDGRGLVSGATLVDEHGEFATYTDGDTVMFSTEFHGEPWLVEQLGPNEYLGFHGTATATVQAPLGTVSVPFRGYIEHCALTAPATTYASCTPPNRITRCTSENHRLTLTRH
jgi:hypothetical protein